MKNKAPLTMMEQVIMVLIFALAAALCLQAFACANETSKANALRDQAVIYGQTAAETMKHTGGDWAAAAELLDGEAANGSIQAPWPGGTLTITPDHCDQPLLGKAMVTVLDESGQALFTLPVAWQEGGQP